MIARGHDLYGDWYTLYQLIDSAAILVGNEARQAEIPLDVVEDLIVLLVETSQFAPGRWADLTKRNHEALGDLLLKFDRGELTLLARRTAEKFGSTVREFVDRTINEVEAVRKERVARTNPE
ncbi:MAG: hypothetical protein KJ025_06115 [Burkholderiales bacterium]|nr:hypothetical protein [Burkholderiales bacterium]